MKTVLLLLLLLYLHKKNPFNILKYKEKVFKLLLWPKLNTWNNFTRLVMDILQRFWYFSYDVCLNVQFKLFIFS